MNLADLVILIIVLAIFFICVRKLYNNYKCVEKGGGCAGCALSGNCHKELLKKKPVNQTKNIQ